MNHGILSLVSENDIISFNIFRINPSYTHLFFIYVVTTQESEGFTLFINVRENY